MTDARTSTHYQLQSQIASSGTMEGQWVDSPMIRPAHTRQEAEEQVPEVKIIVPTIAHRQFRVRQTTTRVRVYLPIQEGA